MWTPRNWMTLAAIFGLLAVAGGAFGAHGVADPKARSWLQTGAEYALAHVLATFACAILAQLGARRTGIAAGFFLTGIVLFTGSLFTMGLGGPRWLGAVTPLGGLSFMIGWAALAWAARGIQRL